MSINSSSPNYSNAAIRNSSVTGVSGFFYNDSAGPNKGFGGHINSGALAPYPDGTLSVMGDRVPVTLGVNGNEIIRIRDDTGNVGIGQSVPVYKLDVPFPRMKG